MAFNPIVKNLNMVSINQQTMPSQQEIDQSVQENISKIDLDAINEFMVDNMSTIINSNISLNAKNIRLRKVVDIMSSKVAPATACSKGCGHCCKMAVTILQWEANQIADATGLTPVVPKVSLNDAEYDTAKYRGVPCPFLVDNSCSIYEHRPLACRAHVNVSKYPELCDNITHPNQTVPQLNSDSLWMAQATINMTNPVAADIRVFFPTAVK